MPISVMAITHLRESLDYQVLIVVVVRRSGLVFASTQVQTEYGSARGRGKIVSLSE